MAGTRQDNTEQDPAILTLERIFVDKEFDAKSVSPLRWLADDSGYLVLETAESDSDHSPKPQQIIHYDLTSGKSQRLASAEHLTAPDAEKPLKAADFSWSETARRLLIFTNTKRVWRHNTRGDYWVLDVDDGRLRQLGGDVPEASLMFAKFSPDGRSVAYVHQNNIYVQSLDSDEILQITSDGSDTIINGTSDWVNEEELSLRDCFRWSPDSRTIAYWQFDISDVGQFNLINNTDSLYPVLKPFPYPKVGEINSACRVGVVSAAGGETTWFNLSDDPRSHYIHRLIWADNSADLIIQQLNRPQNRNQVILGHTSDGSHEIILTEEDEAWVDVHDGLKLVNDGQSFTWLSDRDGWRHIYLVSRNGRDIQQLTSGEFDVLNIVGLDEANGQVYFHASPDNPTQCYLFQAALDGSGLIERLTPADQPGTHSYQLSKKAKWAVHTYTTIDLPPVTSLISLPDHQQVKVLQDNQALLEKVKALHVQPAEFFKVDIGDGVVLDAWCMKPADFDPDKSYPLLFYIYGEPSSSTVIDAWTASRELWHQYLVQQGFIVMSVESVGTPAPRGRSWRKTMYRKIGITSAADQAAALKVILKERPYLDPERVGIWGWSGGGTMTLNMLFRYPELYKTGIAIAAVSDFRLYDTIYQERYMGLLADNEEGFIESAAITHAHKLAGNLLLIHGTGDDNVHYQSLEKLTNELVKHNKPFTMMAYPNRSHGIREGDNTYLHLHNLMARYLTQNLMNG